MMPYCIKHGIGRFGWGSLAEGFLTDNFDLESLDRRDFRRRHPYGQPENYRKITHVKNALGQIAGKEGRKDTSLVIAWELMHTGLTGAIIGIRNEKEAREMLDGVGWKLDHEQMEAIRNALAIWEMR